MEKKTPEVYIKARSTNGINCLMSRNCTTSRAQLNAIPVPKSQAKSTATGINSMFAVIGSPVTGTITNSTSSAGSSVKRSDSKVALGSSPRGNCTEVINPWLPASGRHALGERVGKEVEY